MKKGLGIVFVIAIILGLGILLFSDRITFERDEARVNLEEAYREITKQDVRRRKGIEEGNIAYEERSNKVVEDLEAQAKAEYINSLKDLFDKNKHLLDSGDDVEHAIDLKMFKQGDEYYFGDLFWNITFEQVSNGVDYSLLEDPDRTAASDGYMYYVSDGKYVLYGKTATATFGFKEDRLKTVQLNFVPGEKQKKVEAFFDSTVEALVDIYGKESMKEDNKAAGHISYLWETEDTMLRIELIDAQVIISVGVREI